MPPSKGPRRKKPRARPVAKPDASADKKQRVKNALANWGAAAPKLAPWIKAFGAAALVCVGAAAWFSTSASGDARTRGLIRGHRVAVHTAPRLTSRVIFRADWATPIEFAAADGAWVRVVSSAPAFEGWVEKKYVGP